MERYLYDKNICREFNLNTGECTEPDPSPPDPTIPTNQVIRPVQVIAECRKVAVYQFAPNDVINVTAFP